MQSSHCTISNGELSDRLCDSLNRGLTLVRLGVNTTAINKVSHIYIKKIKRLYQNSVADAWLKNKLFQLC